VDGGNVPESLDAHSVKSYASDAHESEHWRTFEVVTA
jgi:hypothetical protein